MGCFDNNMENLACFTIGHSTHPIEDFIGLLKKYSISHLIDVRSIPYSRYNPQYNRENLISSLSDEKIKYSYLGDRLGARYNDPKLYFADKRIVDFRKVRELKSFKEAILEVKECIKAADKLALMCAEKEPFNCHRFVLDSYALAQEGVEVKHILANGEIVLNNELEDRLICEYNPDYKQQDLFSSPKSRKDAVLEGYLLRNRDFG